MLSLNGSMATAHSQRYHRSGCTRSSQALPLAFKSVTETHVPKHIDLNGTVVLNALEALRYTSKMMHKMYLIGSLESYHSYVLVARLLAADMKRDPNNII
jgi:hypothetical protein